MAKNTNKRIPVKWIRDRAKSAYQKKPHCFVCGTGSDLELHHTHSITLLLEIWKKQKGYSLETDEDVLKVRDEFISEHRREIYDEVYTLCNPHHVQLHGVFGKAPPLSSTDRQKVWLTEQAALFSGNPVVSEPELKSKSVSFRVSNWFAEFYSTEQVSFSSLSKA